MVGVIVVCAILAVVSIVVSIASILAMNNVGNEQENYKD